MKSKKLMLSFSAVIVMAITLAFVLPLASLSGTADVAYAAADSYYSPVTATSGTALLGQLHDLIVTTHTHYSTYADCSDPSIVKKTDAGKSSGTVMEFYTQADMSSTWGSGNPGTWNREHVWPKSQSNGLWTSVSNGTTGAGADLHHIRPAESNLNSRRGNQLFGKTSNGSALYATGISGIVGGYSDGSRFEPIDSVKGDVARIVMYVYTHYNKASTVGGKVESSKTSGNLPITNIISAGGEANAWALLLEWNKLDPVDDIERNRNEAVYNIQHNRNPFIDNERYADAIWGGGTMEQVELQSLSLTPNALGLDIGGSQTLTVSATPSNANASVTWSSSDTSVATVVNGKVTAVSGGTATITATSTQNANIKATATVLVRTPKQATAIEISGTPTTTQYQAGQTFNPAGLKVTVTYDDGSEFMFNALSDLNQFDWLDAATGQALLTINTTAIKCKVDNVEKICTFTITVTEAPEQISGFVASVSAIGSATTMQQRFDCIKTALAAYNQLTAAEKENLSAQGAYQTLLDEIDRYNDKARVANETMKYATNTGAYAVAGASLALSALVAVLKRKFG